MSTCAVLLVKDEADIIEVTVRHLTAHVDEILVQDNASTDGTLDLLRSLEDDYAGDLEVIVDPDPAYYQAEKTTALALLALERGHRWVIPCDADEIWYAPEGRPIRDWLDALGREHHFVKAEIYNHIATGLDEGHAWRFDFEKPITEDNPKVGVWRCALCGTERDYRIDVAPPADGCALVDPVESLRWRQRAPLDMRWGKVACRTRPDLEIHQGNHSASTHGIGATGYGLGIRHFPYRSADQFVRKAVNGAAAYAATALPESVGAHWRMYGQIVAEHGEDAARDWFYEHFYSADPHLDGSLVEDPAPVGR